MRAYKAYRFVLIVLVAVAALYHLLYGSRGPKIDQEIHNQDSDTPEVYPHSDTHLCFIIRTYWKHGISEGQEGAPLINMLKYLSNSPHQKWEALLMVMDKKPFDDLTNIVRGFNDDRIWIFAEKVGDQYSAKLPDGSWRAEYHDLLYSLTDEAIQACPSATQWVIITNGDNEYDPAFISTILRAPKDADIIAFDFYSRYQRVTAAPCERFAAVLGAPPCKENQLRFCNTDLAAAIYRWPRFIREERAFSKMESHGIGLNDGLLARLLRNSGWKVHRIMDVCLLSHSPSPQLCAARNGVWDDSVYAMFQHSGGRCIDGTQAKQLLTEDSGLEMIELPVSHDGKSFGFKKKPVVLRCVRRKFRQPFQNQFYPKECAATMDGGVDY